LAAAVPTSVASDEPPIDLRRVLAALRRSWFIIVALVLVITTVAVALVSHVAPRYRASARLIEDATVGAAPADGLAVDRELQTVRALATSDAVLDAAARALPRGSARPLPGDIRARIVADDNVLVITATAGDGRSATRIANAVAAALIAERARVKRTVATTTREALTRTLRRLRRTGAAKSVLEALRLRVSAAVADEATTGDDLRLVEPAAAPSSPYAPQPARAAALAALAALLIGVLIAIACDQLRPRTDDGRGLSRALGLPLLAVLLDPPAPPAALRPWWWLRVRFALLRRRLPSSPARAPAAQLISRVREHRVTEAVTAAATPFAQRLARSVARLRARRARPRVAREILAAHAQQALVGAVRHALPATRRRQRVLLVCGINRRARAATVAWALATGLAECGLATLLVVADARAAREAERRRTAARVGVGPAVQTPDGLDVTAVRDPSGIDAAFARLRYSQYDYVVVAGPPLDAGIEARLVARHVRAAIVAGRIDRTRVAQATHARRLLDALGLHGLGAVMTTDTPEAQPHSGGVEGVAPLRTRLRTDAPSGTERLSLAEARSAEPPRSAANGRGKRPVATAGERQPANNE
jgi:capsular polysaccharide biosynthesis protein/Mrp family chromosome partitioning ATPase